MRRVLMTADAVGGVWTYALELAAGLLPLGTEVTLAVMGPAPDAAQLAAARAAGVAGVQHRPYPLEWMPEPWEGVDRAGDWLLSLAAETEADVVHLNGFAHGALAWSVPAVVVAHSDVVSWWAAVHGSPPPPEWDTYRCRVRAGLDGAGAVVAPTRWMLDEVRRWYGVGRGMVIPNGRSQAMPATLDVREEVVLAVGRLWDEAKNVAALAAVAVDLDWPVALAGDPPAPERRAEGATAAVEGGHGLRWLGRLGSDELAGWYRRAGMFCSPARYEPFGLAALEAGLAGCPLVLGDIPSLHEVWGEAACFVAPDDRDGLRACLGEMSRDPERRRVMGDKARQRAQELTPRAMAGSYEELYRTLDSGGAS